MAVAHILVVDDEPDIRISIQDILLDEGYDVSVAESGEAALELLESVNGPESWQLTHSR